MIHRIRIQNCFRHPDTTLDLKNGLTGIFGANEAGKSLIFEMISYALFGSVALRGSAPDYKKLIVTMDFEIGGRVYQVYRAGSKALLTREGKELATGQKPINAEIIRLLGYDYKVFCVANYSPQGELCNLSRMKPAERKSMVDNVVGLGIIDKVIDSIANQCRSLNGQITGMNAWLIEPVAPERPAGYRKAGIIATEIEKLSESVRTFNFIDQWLRQPAAPPPIEPTAPNHASKKELVKLQQKWNEKAGRQRELSALLRNYSKPEHTKKELEAMKRQWENFHRKNDLLAKVRGFAAEPKYTKEQLDGFTTQAFEASRWETKKRLEAVGHNECPNCHHTWFLQADQLAAFADAKETPQPPYMPYSSDYALIDLYEGQKAEREAIAKKLGPIMDVEMPAISLSDINIQLDNIDKQAEMEILLKEQQEVNAELNKPQPDYLRMIDNWNIYEREKAGFESKQEAYDAWKEEYVAKYSQWEQLKDFPARVAALQAELNSAVVYERLWANYETAVTQWQEQTEEVDELRFRLSQMEKAREAMRNLRVSVKKFLVPSLNKVASHLLAQMTGGARNIIEISEEFDISVDGQALATLSGSGQAVSNLAIRIALGQVLIAKKFPIFMADEIDGDMDEERAGFTAECLRRITKHVNQFLLISHKRPLADNYIELGRA